MTEPESDGLHPDPEQDPMAVLDSAAAGDLEGVRKIVEALPEALGLQDVEGWTPLHWTAVGGYGEVAEFLLSHGADPNSINKEGLTPLHLAASAGKVELVQLFLERGSAAGMKSPVTGETALHKAALAKTASLPGSVAQITAALISHGADVNSVESRHSRTPLHLAAISGHSEVTERFLDSGAEIDAKDVTGSTSLHYACENGHAEGAGLLIRKGADPAARDQTHGRTPLHRAAGSGQTETVRLLLSSGVDTNARDEAHGMTALHLAAASEDPTTGNWQSKEISVLLLGAGADIHSRTDCGETALHLASRAGKPELIRLLLARGANVAEAASRSGRTALHDAAAEGQWNAARLLLTHGAKIDIPDARYGRTPLHYAAMFGREDVLRLLISEGAATDARDRHGHTPLHWASENGHRQALEELLRADVDPNARTRSGETALSIAKRSGRSDIISLLESHRAVE